MVDIERQPRKRNFSSDELRADICTLAEQIGNSHLLIAAVVKALKLLYPEKYKDLMPIEVFNCPRKESRLRLEKDRKLTGRWYINVKPMTEIPVRVKKKLKPPPLLKCRSCGEFVELRDSWVIGKVAAGEYPCKCGAKTVWRSDIREENSKELLQKFKKGKKSKDDKQNVKL